MLYQLVEKSNKQDGQGNLQCEFWLRDGSGGYSLLRVPCEMFDAFRLGDRVELMLVAYDPSQVNRPLISHAAPEKTIGEGETTHPVMNEAAATVEEETNA